MAALTCEAIPEVYRVDLYLLHRLRRTGRHDWEPLSRVVTLGRDDDLQPYSQAARVLADAGLVDAGDR